MRKIIFILFLSNLFVLHAQHEISDVDTTVRYQEEFYKDGELNLTPFYAYFDLITEQYQYVPADSIGFIDILDTNKIALLQHGKWKIDFQEKSKDYYFLINYEHDFPKGKFYKFNSKNELIETWTHYPVIKGEEQFFGYQIIHFYKGIIGEISYHQFQNQRTNLFYWNTTSYDKQGRIESYYLYDESLAISHTKKYKNGELIYEYKRTADEWFEKKWNHKRNRLKVTEYGDGRRILFYKNGELVKEKIKK